MEISESERKAIIAVLQAGEQFGYGNMIAHLSTAWARVLMEDHRMPEATARLASRSEGYPFKMQEDLIQNGRWDETGGRYKTSKKPTSKRKRSVR